MVKNYLPIGIPVRNAEKTIASTLNSFLEVDIPENLEKKIIVCANGCSDRTEEIVTKMAEKYPEIELISTKKVGKANAWNLINKHVGDSDFIVFGDADISVDKNAISLLYEGLVSNPNLAVSTAYSKRKSLEGSFGMHMINSICFKIPTRQTVGGRLYIIRRGAIDRIPEHIINDDGWLTRILGKERIKRNMDAVVYFDPPKTVKDYFKYRTRVEMGRCQLKKEYPELDHSIDGQLRGERLCSFLKNLELKDWLYSLLSFPLFLSIVYSSKIKAAFDFNPNKTISEWREPKSSKSKKFLENILLKQERVGKDGKIFNIYKLRTMIPGSDNYFNEVINNKGRGLYGKLKDDPRITKFGKFLRRYWIDEVPQVINITKGEMSILGVRPLTPDLFEKLPENLKAERKKYKPGAISQLYANRNILNYEDRVTSEERYFKEKNLRPVRTDIEYFFKIVYNILVKGARGV